MKKAGLLVFTLFLLFSFPALAQENAAVFHAKGILHFSNGEYKEALDLFKQSYGLDPRHPQNLHWLGLTHLRLGSPYHASRYLKKLLKKNPDYQEAYFDYATSLFRQGRFKKAKYWLEKVLESSPTPQQADVSRQWLRQIEEKTASADPQAKLKRWKLGATASAFFDSNVPRDPDGEDLAEFSDQKDYLTSGSLDFRYHLLHREETQLYLNYDGYQSVHLNWYFDANRFNYGRHRGGMELVHQVNDFIQWRLPASYSYSYLGKAKFLQDADFHSILDMVHMQHWLFSVTAGVRQNWFFQSLTNNAQDRDAIQPYVRLEEYFFAPHNRNVYFKVGYGFDKNYADGTDWEFYAHHVLYTLHFPIMWKINFLMLGDAVAKRNFQYTDSVFNRLRQDKSLSNTVVFSRDIFPWLNVGATYSFSVRSSTLTRYTYKRHVAGLTLSTKL